MELLNVIKRYFVTGTDTSVGKTIASMAMLQFVDTRGFTAIGYKPIASGCKTTTEGIRNNDALLLQSNSNVMVDYQEINIYTFIEPTSPHIMNVDKKLTVCTNLSMGLRALEKKANWIFIEGAGGWFTPIAETLTFADWVISEKLQVILVVGIRLGCINHALLTAMAIQYSGLRLVGWIANNIMGSDNKRYVEYLTTLKKMLPTLFLGEIPWIDSPENYKSLWRYIDLKGLEYN